MTSLERNAKVYNTPFNTTNTLLAPTTYMGQNPESARFGETIAKFVFVQAFW